MLRCLKKFDDTGFSYALSQFKGKYKMPVLFTLMKFEVVRFNQIKKYLGKISYKVLSETLKELETSGLINRKEYPQIPPKVEYSLTEKRKIFNSNSRQHLRMGRHS